MKSFESSSNKFAEHARLRRANSERICAEPELFKICAGCLSVFYRPAPICSFCGGFRWYYDPEALKLIARITERSALPFTAGVAPRLSSGVQETSEGTSESVSDDQN